MIRVGRSPSAIALAIVNVLPEPVMPSRTWASSPRRRPSTSSWIALGWSPPGWYGDTSLKPALPPRPGGLLAEPAPSAATEVGAEAETGPASARPPQIGRAHV